MPWSWQSAATRASWTMLPTVLVLAQRFTIDSGDRKFQAEIAAGGKGRAGLARCQMPGCGRFKAFRSLRLISDTDVVLYPRGHIARSP